MGPQRNNPEGLACSKVFPIPEGILVKKSAVAEKNGPGKNSPARPILH